MTKNGKIWFVLFVIVCIIGATINILNKEKKSTSVYKTVDRTINDNIDYKEIFADYGIFAVNWYYESDGLYETIYKDGRHIWKSKESIVEELANNKTEYWD